MLKYILFYALAASAGFALPVVQQHGDLAPHLVIVTPQAQVHLEPAAKLGPATTFIHHLSPLARIGAPHDETILYVPASGPAPIISIDAPIQSRSGGFDEKNLALQYNPQAKQSSEMVPGQMQATAAASNIASSISSVAQGFTEVASALSPENFFPQPGSNKDERLSSEKIKAESAEQAFLPAGARRFYAIAAAPAVQHVVDFIHGPVLLGPVSTIRARSIQEQESLPALPAEQPKESKPADALQLQPDLKAELQDASLQQPKLEKQQQSGDFGRFLEANALKEELKGETQPQLANQNEGLQSEKLEQSLLPSADSAIEAKPLDKTEIAEEKIQLKSVPHEAAALGDAGVVAPKKQDEAVVVADEVPQPKVA